MTQSYRRIVPSRPGDRALASWPNLVGAGGFVRPEPTSHPLPTGVERDGPVVQLKRRPLVVWASPEHLEGLTGLGLAGSRRTDQAQVLLGADPLEAGQVLEGGSGHRGRVHVELVERLGHGEGGGGQAGPGVRSVTRGDSASIDVRKNCSGLQSCVWPPSTVRAREGAWHRGEVAEYCLEVGWRVREGVVLMTRSRSRSHRASARRRGQVDDERVTGLAR